MDQGATWLLCLTRQAEYPWKTQVSLLDLPDVHLGPLGVSPYSSPVPAGTSGLDAGIFSKDTRAHAGYLSCAPPISPSSVHALDGEDTPLITYLF
jgi:hypothetical protein